MQESGSDHCESVFWCALIPPLLLFKHEPFLSSPPCRSSSLSSLTTKPQFDMQVLPSSLPPSLSYKLFWIAAGNQHRCQPAAISSPLTLFMCVCSSLCERGRRESGKVEAAADENHRADSNQNKTTLSKISLSTSLDLSYTAKNDTFSQRVQHGVYLSRNQNWQQYFCLCFEGYWSNMSLKSQTQVKLVVKVIQCGLSNQNGTFPLRGSYSTGLDSTHVFTFP